MNEERWENERREESDLRWSKQQMQKSESSVYNIKKSRIVVDWRVIIITYVI